MESRETNFKDAAEETVKKIRGQLAYGSNNEIDKDNTDLKHGYAIRAAVPIAALKNALCGNNPTFHVFAKLNSLAIEKYGYGQCGEQAQAVFMCLIEKGIYPVDLCVTTEGGHNLVVVGRAPGSDENDISTWGDNAYVCDPWVNKVYPLSKFETMQKDTSMGKYNEEIYKNLTIPPHYLEGKLCVVHSVQNENELLAFQQNVKIDSAVSAIFSKKIISQEEMSMDIEKMKKNFAAIKNSHLGINQGALPAILEIENFLSLLEDTASPQKSTTYRQSIFAKKP